MRAGRYSSPDYDAGPATRAGKQRTMRGRPIGGYSMQIIKAIAFVIEAIMAIYWLLKDDRQRAIFYMILMLFLV